MKSIILFVVFSCFASCVGSIEVKKTSPLKYQYAFDAWYKLKSKLNKIKEPTGQLTLRRGIALAILKSPAMRLSKLEVKSRNAIALQEGLYANPEFEFEMENFGGGGDAQQFSALEATVKLSQLLELGGKPSKRRQVALFEKKSALWKLILSKIDIINKTAEAFLDVATCQEKVKLKKQRVALTEKIYNLVSVRVKVGQISTIELYRARSELLRARFGLKRTQQQLINLRKRLVAIWGSDTPRFSRVAIDFYSVKFIPNKNKIIQYIKKNPKLRFLRNELEKQKAVLLLAKSGRVPDLKLSGGFRYSRATRTGSFLVGLSIPLPLFNRNQGKVRESRFRVEQAKVKQKQMLLRMKGRFLVVYQKLKQAYLESNAIKKIILPNAQKAYKAVMSSYKEGKHDLLSVLSARQKLFEVKALYLDSLISYHRAVLGIERLMGVPLSVIKK